MIRKKRPPRNKNHIERNGCTPHLEPVVSVLMPTRNSAKTIKKALDVLVECKLIKEILIADGGSEDETQEIIRTYNCELVKILSVMDGGLYDGVNKLIPFITGRYVIFMNSDDIANCEYIDAAIQELEKFKYDYIFGHIIYGTEIRLPRFLEPPILYKPRQLMPFPHVSLVMGVDLFKKVGLFNEKYRIAADLDFINRLMKLSNKGMYLKMVAAICAANGLSSGNKQVYESWLIAMRHGRSVLRSTAVAIAVYFFRNCLIPYRKFLQVKKK